MLRTAFVSVSLLFVVCEIVRVISADWIEPIKKHQSISQVNLKIEDLVPLLPNNLLGIFLQLLKLLHAPSQTLTIRVAVNLCPFPPMLRRLGSLAFFVRLLRFDFRHVIQEAFSCCGGAGEVSLRYTLEPPCM